MYWHIGAGEAGVPAIRLPRDRDRLGRPLKRTRPARRDASNLGEDHKAVIQLCAVPDLRRGEAGVAVPALEARVARCLTRLHAAEVGLESTRYPLRHVLQDLAVNLAVFRQGLFDTGQLGLLLGVGNRDTAHPPGFLTLAKSGIVDVAAEHEGTIKQPGPFGGGLEFVLVGLVNAVLYHLWLFYMTDKRPANRRKSRGPTGPPGFHPHASRQGASPVFAKSGS
jgi:hypothetical protein